MESSAATKIRVALRELLIEQRHSLDRLLEYLDDPSVPPVRLVELIDAMGQLGERKSPLVRALREEVSEMRRREEERSVRQFVLRALEYIGAPQPAGLLQEFIWARERVELNTRGFGALRRDEVRAWRRAPARRMAYIVPVLDSDGHALARWMARSDWPLARRIVVGSAEQLFGVKRLESLFRARQELPVTEVVDPYIPLIRRYAPEVLEIKPPPVRPGEDEVAWLVSVRHHLQGEQVQLEETVGRDQQKIAWNLEMLSEEQQLWGR